MSRKKSTVSRVENVNIEIDYDKLAQAISKANQENGKKSSSHSKVRSKIMNTLNGIIYSSIYIFCFFGVRYVWKSFSYTSTNDLIARIIMSVILIVAGIFMFLSQQESFDDTYEETKDHFNTNLSLVALIVALIALYKEIE